MDTAWMVIRAISIAKTTSDAQEMEYSHVFERFPPLECTEVINVVLTLLKRL